MRKIFSILPVILSVASAVLALAGCDKPRVLAAPLDSTKASPATKVEVVHPIKQAIQRTVEQPGQIEAAETTPMYAKLAGYARNVSVDIGDRVKKDQVLCELWVPEIVADVEQKAAMLHQAEAKKVQAQSAVKVAEAGLVSSQSKAIEAKAGVKKAEADRVRYQSEFDRARQLVSERAVTGGMLDEARSRLQSAEAGKDAVEAAVRSAESAVIEATANVDKARSDVVAAEAAIAVAQAEVDRAEALRAYSQDRGPVRRCRQPADRGHGAPHRGRHAGGAAIPPGEDRGGNGRGRGPRDVRRSRECGRQGQRARAGPRRQTGGGRRLAHRLQPRQRDPHPPGRDHDLLQPHRLAPAGIIYRLCLDRRRGAPRRLTVPTTAIVRDGAAAFIASVWTGTESGGRRSPPASPTRPRRRSCQASKETRPSSRSAPPPWPKVKA